MRKAVVAFAAGCFVLGAAGAAAAAVVAAGPGGFSSGYLPPTVEIDEGESLTFANGDVAPHSVVALDAFLPKKKAKKTDWCAAFDVRACPIFWSETIGSGRTTDVLGVESLKSGDTYTFFCTEHHNMRGTLVVR